MGVNDFLDRMYWQERAGSALDALAWDQRRIDMEHSNYMHNKSRDPLAEIAEIDRLLFDLKLKQMMKQSGRSAIDFSKITPKLPTYPLVYPSSTPSETESSD